MHERRKRSNIISQFLALIPQGVDFSLRGRIGNGQPANLPVGVSERHCSLVGACVLNNRRCTVKSNPAAHGPHDRLPGRFSIPCVMLKIDQ